MHEIGALHESDVGEVQVAEDLILEASGAFLVGAGQVDAAGVTPQALFVVDVVVVDTRRLCVKIQSFNIILHQPSGCISSVELVRYMTKRPH